MPLTVQLNGQSRDFANLAPATTLDLLVEELKLQKDRVAIEHNGEIIPRTSWSQVTLKDGDKLEMVHFVGGGTGSNIRDSSAW